jgi:hypothetical protein
MHILVGEKKLHMMRAHFFKLFAQNQSINQKVISRDPLRKDVY